MRIIALLLALLCVLLHESSVLGAPPTRYTHVQPFLLLYTHTHRSHIKLLAPPAML